MQRGEGKAKQLDFATSIASMPQYQIIVNHFGPDMMINRLNYLASK